MLPSSSEPVLIEGPVSKRGKSVAGIGLWWKTRYVRLTSSFLTITDLKLQTLLASIPTADFLFCAPVKTRRATGRRFLLRLLDSSVLQFATLTPNECVQWVTVINGVIAVCEKQRAKDTLAWQRRKETALLGGAAPFALSSPQLTNGFTPATPTSASTPLPLIPFTLPLTPSSIPPAPTPGRAVTALAPATTPSLPPGGGRVPPGLAPVEGGLTRASSTGVIMQRHELERRQSRDRSVEHSRAQAALQAQGRGASRSRGDSAGKEERKAARVNWEEKSPRGDDRDSRLRSSRRRDAGGYAGQYSDEEKEHGRRGGYDRYSSSRDASEEEWERRHGLRYHDYPPYPPPPPTRGGSSTPPFSSPPSVAPLPALGSGIGELGPPPTQRLLFFTLLFLLFSFTILLSGYTSRTSSQVAALYAQHVRHPNATLHSYDAVLGEVVASWPLLGASVSGLYLAYLFQVVMRGKGGRGGDEVDWLGGGLAGVVCSYCLHAAALDFRAHMQVSTQRWRRRSPWSCLDVFPIFSRSQC